jgi:DNA mismatch repair protein MutS2
LVRTPEQSQQHLDDEQDESLSILAQLCREFVHGLPHNFIGAAQELDYDKIFEAHARLAPSLLGKRALVKELQPKTDVLLIDNSLKEIQELRVFIAAGEAPGFDGLDDIASIVRKTEIAGSTIYADEGARILRVLKGMRLLREFFSRRAKDAPLLWKTAVQLLDDRLLEMHFSSVFDEQGNIKDSASTDLRKIRQEIIETAERLRSRLNSILKKLTEDDLVQDDLITQRDGRYVVPIKAESKRKVPGLIHSVSQTGHTVFIEPTETLDLNNDLRSLEFAEVREIERILRGLADQLRQSVPQLLSALKAAAHLEAVYAKARYADQYQTNPAVVHQQVKGRPRKIVLKQARHPLLIQKIGREKTIPANIELDEDRRTLVLTGPNAGGKTVLLKTTGLIVMMAQAGLPVTADPDAQLPLMDGVYVEIGDMQSLADDLSTFSSHITTLADILSHTTRESLLLLDEIGGGTAPEEGGALAESILESLTRIGAFTMATTHYGRLAAFAEAVPGAVNGSMEFSRETLTPTFRFRLGVPGSSHAFDIAERYGLSKKLVQRANELRGGDSDRLDELVKSLEDLQREARERKEEAERELGKARIARVDFERRRDEVEDIRRTAKAKATQEADELLSRANSFIETAVREARELAKTSDATKRDEELKALRRDQDLRKKELQQAVDKTKESLKSTKPATTNGEAKLEVGSKVKLKDNPGQTGEVLSIKGKDIEVAFGTMRMRLTANKLDVISGAEARTTTRTQKEVSSTVKYLTEFQETRLDVRGQYGDEAIMQIEKFMADASARGLERVEIIHGIGTGALGRRVSTHLKGHPLVQSFRYGEPQEGGSGVTIIEFK